MGIGLSDKEHLLHCMEVRASHPQPYILDLRIFANAQSSSSHLAAKENPNFPRRGLLIVDPSELNTSSVVHFERRTEFSCTQRHTEIPLSSSRSKLVDKSQKCQLLVACHGVHFREKKGASERLIVVSRCE